MLTLGKHNTVRKKIKFQCNNKRSSNYTQKEQMVNTFWVVFEAFTEEALELALKE